MQQPQLADFFVNEAVKTVLILYPKLVSDQVLIVIRWSRQARGKLSKQNYYIPEHPLYEINTTFFIQI